MATSKQLLSAREESELALKKVQERVLSVLIIGITAFPVGALIGISAVVVGQGRTGAGIALLGMCALIGMTAVGAASVFRSRSPVRPITLLGALPAVIAAIVVFS